MKKLVIIPAYNEESSIEAQYEEVRKQAPDYDVLVINDGSGDRTAELCYNH
ncbi:MAG: glycosyltransferase, partial [Lachnospiraceae bacterium]|nr:glycosyltransferase [Lachnospiraceae bacterium]